MVAGTVYLIKNKKTGSKYVGATTTTLKKRFSAHVSASQRWDYPIHREIKNYGRKAFTITPLQNAYSKEKLLELEKHWIESLDTFRNGLNETIGGAGVSKMTNEAKAEIVETWFRVKNVPQVAAELGYYPLIVYRYLKEAGITFEYTHPVKVHQTGHTFPSIISCAMWVSEQEGIPLEPTRTAIRDRLNGKIDPDTKYKGKYTFAKEVSNDAL